MFFEVLGWIFLGLLGYTVIPRTTLVWFMAYFMSIKYEFSMGGDSVVVITLCMMVAFALDCLSIAIMEQE